MTARMVNAIATANTNLAGFDFGFGAMFPSWLQYRTFRGANREKWVSHFTLRMIIILMETIKDLYQTRLARAPAPSIAHVVASRVPVPKARPGPPHQGRRHAAHYSRGVRLHDQHGQAAGVAYPLAAGLQAHPRERGPLAGPSSWRYSWMPSWTLRRRSCPQRPQGQGRARTDHRRPSGEWNEDDYDVLADSVVVGRIFKANAAPVRRPAPA